MSNSNNLWLLKRAVRAFEDVERVSLLLEKKDAVLTDITTVLAVKDPGSVDEYFRQTEEIRKQYEEKRSEWKRKESRR